jgi:hypothetical protein
LLRSVTQGICYLKDSEKKRFCRWMLKSDGQLLRGARCSVIMVGSLTIAPRKHILEAFATSEGRRRVIQKWNNQVVRVFHNCNEMYVFTDFTAVLSSMTMCGNLVQHRSTNYDSYTPQCKTILSILLLANDPLCMNASTSYRMNTDAILCQCTMKQDIMYKASLPTC